MILEGIVTTVDQDGATHISPMGPIVDRQVTRLCLRPFQTSQTYQNLKRNGVGVFHVTDDVELLARSAVGQPSLPKLLAVDGVPGHVLADACRWYAFRVENLQDDEPRTTIDCRIETSGQIRDFFGFNRAKHAVVEAAILATRIDFLDPDDVQQQFATLAIMVDKTAGEQEHRAFRFLQEYVRRQSHLKRQSSSDPSLVLNPALPVSTAAPTSTNKALRLTTPSRLHFGLLSFNASPGERQFGGVGLMVDQPGVSISIEPARHFCVQGPLSSRLVKFADTWNKFERRSELPACRLTVHQCAPQHAGFGTGTQLGLGVAHLLYLYTGSADPSVARLAESVGRGQRSSVGLYGFERGGLIYELGKSSDERVGTLSERVTMPENWRVVQWTPTTLRGLFGRDEQRAFGELPSISSGVTRELQVIAEQQMLPAARLADLDTFGEAVYQYGLIAGNCFAAKQGGSFADPRLAAWVRRLRDHGIKGVGQSSWGPTIFAIVENIEAAEELVHWSLEASHDCGEVDICVGRIANHGACLTEVART